MIRRALLAAALLLAACAAEAQDQGGGELIELTIPHADRPFATRICRPAAPGPAKLVVINHGSPADAADRPMMRPASCSNEAVRWFTSRGYVAAMPMRRGYGATGGPWAEEFGGCSRGNYGPAGLEAARDILAATRALQARPDVARAPALVVGQSAGGWGVIALSSLNPPEVGAIVNFAGGRGGWQGGLPNQVCRPENLAAAAGEYGRTARVPTLWIYSANDTFFDRPLAIRMSDAYRTAGGQVDFQPLGPYGRDGHGLFFGQGGSEAWGPVVSRFLAGR
ncbi:alpha/beta hydrolase family protein [Roseococcus sp. YIM B11640]|uniref:alpha/beta hydrolase family protein n=1 Tax=Roseococcus sp. YIM B11640 TaxID=3133973 RepID=UPI003C7C14B7